MAVVSCAVLYVCTVSMTATLCLLVVLTESACTCWSTVLQSILPVARKDFVLICTYLCKVRYNYATGSRKHQLLVGSKLYQALYGSHILVLTLPV